MGCFVRLQYEYEYEYVYFVFSTSTFNTVFLLFQILCTFLQGLGEQKRTKYKINGTATTAIEESNPNLVYSYEYEYVKYCTTVYELPPRLLVFFILFGFAIQSIRVTRTVYEHCSL